MLQALRTRTNLLLLMTLIGALAALITGLITVTAQAVPGKANADQARIEAVSAAATTELNALFSVDYNHLDTWQSTLMAGATGDFLSQLQAKLETNKAAVYQQKIMGTVKVLDVGISSLKEPSGTAGWTAVVYAAADPKETAPSLKGIAATDSCAANTICHQYVVKLGLVETNQGWKVSSLEVAG